MVKVQKPIPKSFSKQGPSDMVSKKTNAEKLKKTVKKEKVMVAAAASETKKKVAALVSKKKEVPLTKQTKEEVAAKKRKIEKDAEIVPKKQVKKQQPDGSKPKKNKAVTSKKSPLVLAPPESPAPAPKPKPDVKPKTNPADIGKQKEKLRRAQKHLAKKLSQEQATQKAQAALEKKSKKIKKSVKPVVAVTAIPKTPLSNLQKKKKAKRAFRQLQSKKRVQKATKPKPFACEPLEVDEEHLDEIVTVETVEKIVEALKKQAAEEVKNKKKQTIFTDYRYMLNVSSFKIPSCAKRMVRLDLEHSLVKVPGDDVVLVVTDLKRGARVDYEPTIQHYEDLFREAGIEGLKIVPFNQLRNECNTYEAVRKFGNLFDYYLCDGRLAGQLAGMMGKIFQKPRRAFHSVCMSKPNLKAEFNRALHRTAYRQLTKSNLVTMPIGVHTHSAREIAENVVRVVKQLKESFPGGVVNLRAMHLKIDIVGTSALPVYLNLGQGPPEVPYIVGPREQRMLKLRKDANYVLAKFNLTKDAELQKLGKTAAERKRRVIEARAALKRAEDDQPVDDDGEDSAVPAKKARKDEQVERDVAKKSVEKPEHGNDEDDVDDVEDDDEDDDEGDEEDNEDIGSEDDVDDDDDDDDDVDEDDAEDDDDDDVGVDDDDDDDDDDNENADGNDDDDDEDDDEDDDDDA